jgi:hypothetical protein
VTTLVLARRACFSTFISKAVDSTRLTRHQVDRRSEQMDDPQPQ